MDAETMQVLAAPIKGNLNIFMEWAILVWLEINRRRQIIGLIPVSTRRNW
jgi:hypothetical protein